MNEVDALQGVTRIWGEYIFGSMLVVMCVWHYLTVRAHREEIKEWKTALKEEQANHQKTRDRHLQDIGAIQNLGETVDDLNKTVQGLFLDRRRV